MRHLLIVPLLCLLPPSLVAWGFEKPATCVLEDKSVLGRSSSGIAQVSNLADIQIRCNIPARPVPTKPGEFRNGLRATATSYKISPDGSKEPVATEVNVSGGGGSEQGEWVFFSAHIPLEPAELDKEARRYLARMENEDSKNKSAPTELLTQEAQQRTLKLLHELVYQHRVGHFVVKCRVVDADQVLGVGTIELEVVFKGRFSDNGLPGAPPV